MVPRIRAIWFAGVIALSVTPCLWSHPIVDHAVACNVLTRAKPGLGAEYTGEVRGGPFDVAVTIPHGMTGWGAAEGAPFHGFAVFLPEDPAACLYFYIQLRVEASERPEHPHQAKRVKIGRVSGWEWRSEGPIEGADWTNIWVVFSVHHDRDHFDDGAVTLAVPTKGLASAEPAFRRFLSTIETP